MLCWFYCSYPQLVAVRVCLGIAGMMLRSVPNPNPTRGWWAHYSEAGLYPGKNHNNMHVRAEKHYICIDDNRSRLLVHDSIPYIFHTADKVQLNTLVSPSLSTIPSRFILRSGYSRRLVFRDIPTQQTVPWRRDSRRRRIFRSISLWH